MKEVLNQNIGIYKITSPSGRIYIGQSKNIKSRFSYYKSLACKNQVKLMRSFKKYGFENHIFETIENCLINDLNDRERFYQEKYDVIKNGLNCILISSKNKPAKRSIETNKKISQALKKRKWKESSKRKLSNSRKGIKFSKEHRENIRKSKTGQKNVRSVVVLNISSGVYYDTIQKASEAHCVDHRSLSRYLNGTRNNKTNLIRV